MLNIIGGLLPNTADALRCCDDGVCKSGSRFFFCSALLRAHEGHLGSYERETGGDGNAVFLLVMLIFLTSIISLIKQETRTFDAEYFQSV